MGGLVFIYRLGSLTLAAITAVIVLGLSISTTRAVHQLLNGAFDGESLNYANLGIASGAMAILTLPVMLFVDFINDGKTGLPIIIEVPWLCVLWVMFLATGISTKNFVHQVNPNGVSCDEIGRLGSQFDEFKKICDEWEPIEIVSWISAGLLFLYSVTLLIISILRAYGGKSMWGTSVKNSEI
ncbi:hypothetical protein GSI_11772 [Ganoderma sinense ZZ0214-1]|uniref:MARVEL domain-containing protein n=1 Tax=Ganoderma sinense ZZ0214-1 TaxID=1077348 RepID=A0A2G8RXG7_9APHY|nr:hypothetical protein GSI_11772 [Ganoderma sinense ZZ0214-1]